MRILVTGGAGFIGSHLCESFKESGHQVLAFDDLSRGSKANLVAGIDLVVADVRDPAAVDKAFSDFCPEVVCHQAAQVSVRDSVADPVYDAKVNVIGSLVLLEACVKHDVKRFMFASTGGAIYGEQEIFPAPEDHPARPLSPYAVAKLAVERYLYFYGVTHGLAGTALRYSNVYGPRQDPHGEAGVVAIFARKMIAGEGPLINGDGEQTRDFVFVKDVAAANLTALQKNVTGAVNIATGKEASVNQVFERLNKITGADVREEHGPAKPGEQKRSVLDIGLAKKLMDWEPRTGLFEGLELTVEYFKQRA